MQTREQGTKSFYATMIALCLGYLVIEGYFNANTLFSVDDFWFAHRAYSYKDGLPYRDFSPYKTVLGYYLLLLPLLSAKGVIGTLVFTKNCFAVLNAMILFIAAAWMRRFFSTKAILISVALILASDVMLAYSTNIRVDLFAYWLGLFALLCLFEKRFSLAGLLMGLGFCFSQKMAWYLFAVNASVGLLYLCKPQRDVIWHLLRFNLTAITIIMLYLAGWAAMSSWENVFHNVFFDAAVMYKLDTYNSLRYLYWQNTLSYNIFLFFFWPLTCISLLDPHKDTDDYQRRTFIILFTTIVILSLSIYKQVFPYYMQVTLPAFLLLYAAFFHWLYQTNAIKKSPILLIVYTIGILLPLGTSCLKQFRNNNQYQIANIETLNTLLQEGDDYIAGIELIYNKSQHIVGLKHLMAPAVQYLYRPTKALQEAMLSSLDEDPNMSVPGILQQLKTAPVKFYVNNYRMEKLPEALLSFLKNDYSHLWGSIYVYTPSIPAGKATFTLKFDGLYEIQGSQGIRLNGQHYKINTKIALKHGRYQSNAAAPYRLKLIPMVMPDVEDRWEWMTI